MIVVLAPLAPVPPFPPGVAVRAVHDARPDEGPLEGVLAGLIATTTDLALVSGGDMPDVSTAVAMEMLSVATVDPGVEAVALDDGGRFRPLPLVVRVADARRAAHALRRGGERRLRSLPESLRTAVIDASTWHALDPERRSVWDIDEPGDLQGR